MMVEEEGRGRDDLDDLDDDDDLIASTPRFLFGETQEAAFYSQRSVADLRLCLLVPSLIVETKSGRQEKREVLKGKKKERERKTSALTFRGKKTS